jgi:hypothetical protein
MPNANLETDLHTVLGRMGEDREPLMGSAGIWTTEQLTAAARLKGNRDEALALLNSLTTVPESLRNQLKELLGNA